MLVAMETQGPEKGDVHGKSADGTVCVCGGVDSDKLAWESGDANLLIKIDVLPFCFKCN